MLGILTRIAAGLLAIQMIGAILQVKLSKGFIGGYELDLLYLAIMISLILTGPGSISIERNILKREIFPKVSKYSINEKKENKWQILLFIVVTWYYYIYDDLIKLEYFCNHIDYVNM